MHEEGVQQFFPFSDNFFLRVKCFVCFSLQSIVNCYFSGRRPNPHINMVDFLELMQGLNFSLS